MKSRKKSDVGETLRKLRKAKKLSQERVAESVGVRDYKTIGSWEKGKTMPALEQFMKLVELYEADAQDILFIKNGDNGEIELASSLCTRDSIKTEHSAAGHNGFIDKLAAQIIKMSEVKQCFIALMILFILQNSPGFLTVREDPVFWLVATVTIIIQLLLVKFVPDKWFEKGVIKRCVSRICQIIKR